jgi:hypothetical protein
MATRVGHKKSVALHLHLNGIRCGRFLPILKWPEERFRVNRLRTLHVFVLLLQRESFKKEMATFYTTERTPMKLAPGKVSFKRYLGTVICGKNYCIIATVRGRFLMY